VGARARHERYDTADGQRFLVVRTIEPWERGIAVVQNWFEEFRRK
jgi:hypothetical protein